MEELKFIIFRIGEQKYGMNLQYIKGIEQNYQVIAVPNTTEAIEGIMNLRGDVIPVYSLRKRFGVTSRIDDSKKSMLVTMSAGSPLAYEVDEVVTIEELKDENVSDMPAVATNEENAFMEKILNINGDIVITINSDKVLSEATRKVVEQMIEENKTSNDKG